MANFPKRTKDPTEAALSAIQEALNIRDDEEERQEVPEERDTVPPPSFDDVIRRSEPATPAFDEAIDLDDDIGSRAAEPPVFRPANDDQQSVGRVLHALQVGSPGTELEFAL